MTDSAKVAQEGLRGLLAVRHPNELRGGYTNIVMSPDKHDQKIIEAFKLGLGAAESAISTQKVAQEEKIVSEDPENLHDFGMSDGELDEVFIANASVHIERMDTTAFWIGIDAPGMAPLMLNTGVHRGIWYFNIQEDSLDDKAQFLSIQRPRNSKSIPVTKPESAISTEAEEMKRMREALESERDAAWAANERDRTKVADAITEITKVLRGREWLASSRGCYEFDDEEYQKEFGWAIEEIHKAVDGLRSVAADWSHSPKTQEAVDKARAPLFPQGAQKEGQA